MRTGSDLRYGLLFDPDATFQPNLYREDASDRANVVLCGGEEPSEGTALPGIFAR